jgi:tRNA splicing ligase
MYNTKLGEFCATHSNWEELLSAEPYSILIKKEDGFVIFNYNQLSSDFSNEIVCEARGIIFKEGEWEYPVCHAFDKFFNYGQDCCDELDWGSVTVSEKIDGSIMKLWCYNDCWHLSTNGLIDAETASIGDVRKDNFAQIFWEALGWRMPGGWKDMLSVFTDWFNGLNPECTYIFELVSPYTRVVIPYKTADIYFLGARNNKTNQQYGCDLNTAIELGVSALHRPKLYQLNTMEQIIAAANELPWDNEGYVCYDNNFNRCKIKSPRYVMAHFARNNNVITRWHLIDIILKGEMEEFKIYASDYADEINYTKKMMDEFITCVDNCALITRNLRKLPRPDAARIIKNFHKLVQTIMFINLDRLVGGKEYTEGWDAYKWERALDNFSNFLERGPENA